TLLYHYITTHLCYTLSLHDALPIYPGPVIPAQRLRGRSPQPVVLAERQCLPSLDHRVPRTLRTHLVSQVLQDLRLPRSHQDEAGDVDDAGLPCARDTGHPDEPDTRALREHLRRDRRAPLVHAAEAVGDVGNRTEVLRGPCLVDLGEDSIGSVGVEPVESAHRLDAQGGALVRQLRHSEPTRGLSRPLQAAVHVGPL